MNMNTHPVFNTDIVYISNNKLLTVTFTNYEHFWLSMVVLKLLLEIIPVLAEAAAAAALLHLKCPPWKAIN
jgi:hypothetical protein